MRFHQTPRRGFALAVSLLAIVIIGALIAGAFFASTQESRVGRNTLVQQRAFSAAEYGLNETVATFDKSLNLTMVAGEVQQLTYNSSSAAGTQPSGARSNVRLTKLNDALYWVVSEGVVNAGLSNQSVRRVSTTFRIRKPLFPIGGAITSKGSISVRGSAEVTGNNTPPVGWTQCAGIGGNDTAAIAVGDSAVVTIQKTDNVTGTADFYRDPRYDDTSTFRQFGSDINFAEMAANADVILTTNRPNPDPVGTDSTCNRTGGNLQTNWGEPWRGFGVNGCKNYFPVIYHDGDLQIDGGRGQGVLLVNGSVRFNGNFEFYGVIIATNDVTKGNGTAKIYGSIIAGDNVRADDTSLLGNTFIFYSKCANESATRASSIIVPVNQRAWADMF